MQGSEKIECDFLRIVVNISQTIPYDFFDEILVELVSTELSFDRY